MKDVAPVLRQIEAISELARGAYLSAFILATLPQWLACKSRLYRNTTIKYKSMQYVDLR